MRAPVVEGQVLAGKYRVERVLGQGGMGVVLAAMHQQLQQRVAIKLLHPGATTDVDVVERFVREARAAVRLKSEHVARVIDVGELEGGAPYMVMEYLEGRDLLQVLRQQGPLDVEEAVGHLLHACEAVAEAHAAGIIHRDLKPANLFLTSAADGSSTVKVLDFGISKAMANAPDGDQDMGLTKTATMLGSPLYMAPEQMRSARSVDVRADIWSLGAVLYQLLTGHVPFETTSLSELILMINQDAPRPPSAHRPDLPPPIEEAILRCLEKDRAKRFQSVAELARAIVPFGPPLGVASLERIERMLGLAPSVSMRERMSSISSLAGGGASSSAPPPARDRVSSIPIAPTGAAAATAPAATMPSGAPAATAQAGAAPPRGAGASATSPGWTSSEPAPTSRRRGGVVIALAAVAMTVLGVVTAAVVVPRLVGRAPADPAATSAPAVEPPAPRAAPPPAAEAAAEAPPAPTAAEVKPAAAAAPAATGEPAAPAPPATATAAPVARPSSAARAAPPPPRTTASPAAPSAAPSAPPANPLQKLTEKGLQ